jgi:DNA-binding PadR family transcriptional regulator
MTAVIFNLPVSVRTLLELMEASTGHPYYAAELQKLTGYTKPTVLGALDRIHEAGFVQMRQESVAEDTNRAPRNYYTLTPHGVAALRLHAPST